MREFDPDDTASFSIPTALRAPVGTHVPEDLKVHARVGAIWLMMAMVVLLVDMRLESAFGGRVDLVPDTLGGLFVLAGVVRIGRVARVIGPARADRTLLVLAVLQLPVLFLIDINGQFEAIAPLATPTWVTVLAPVQMVVALFGTAVVGTVLARTHDALGQLRRRGRWMIARRLCLVLSVGWLPISLPGAVLDDATGLLAGLLGFLAAVLIAVGLTALWFVLRALAGSQSIALPDR